MSSSWLAQVILAHAVDNRVLIVTAKNCPVRELRVLDVNLARYIRERCRAHASNGMIINW